MRQDQNLKNNYLIIFWLIFLVIMILFEALFPRPHFYVINDIETLPLSNIISAYINGSIFDFIHPAVPIIYIPAIVLSFLPLSENPEGILLISRVSLMVINISLIYFGLVLIHKITLLRSILFIAFLFIYPGSNHFIETLSPNGIQIGLGIVICGLGMKLGEPVRKKANFFWYGLALAFAVATKVQALLLVIPLLIASLFIKSEESDPRKQLYLVFFTATTFLFAFGTLTFPVWPAFPFWATHFYWFKNLFIFLKGLLNSEALLIGLLGVFGGTLFIFSVKRLSLVEKFIIFSKNISYKKAYLFISILFAVTIILNLISVVQTGVTYDEIGDSTRNYLPFLGFFAVLIPRSKTEEKISIPIIAAMTLVFSLIGWKGYSNHQLYKSSSKIDSAFRELIKESLSGHSQVVFFAQATFISREYFLLFTDYKYGQRNIMFENQSTDLPFKLDPLMKSLRVLYSRHFDLEKDISTKFSYKYINKLLSYNFLPDIHRRLLINILDAIKHKDICEEPYEGFKKGVSFSLIIPDGLRYMEVDSRVEFRKKLNMQTGSNDLFAKEFDHAPNIAEKFIEKLTNIWTNQCGFEIASNQIKVANNKRHYILSINSKIN
jgi:hypothetical protein